MTEQEVFVLATAPSIPEMLAGKTMEEAGRDNFKGDLLGATPKHAFAAVVDRACKAVWDIQDLDSTVHTSFGDFSARDYLIQITYFRGLRAHDIAKVIGVDPTLQADLVQGLWDELSPVADEWRQMGAFPPRVAVADDAPLQDHLLGLTGRDPNAAQGRFVPMVEFRFARFRSGLYPCWNWAASSTGRAPC